MVCRVNPLFCNGHAKDDIPAPRHKEKVAVIGGGIAGMQAALAAAERGHNVTLYEKGSELGGQLNQFTPVLWFTNDLVRLRDYFKLQIAKFGVTIFLNTEATPAMIDQANYDSVIVAIGSKPVTPPIEGVNGGNVAQVISCFGHEEELGHKVVIIGGGLSGCDTVIYLNEHGHESTVLEMSPYIAALGVTGTRQDIVREFARVNVAYHENIRCTRITSEGVHATNERGEEVFFPADTVLVATGNRAESQAADAYWGTAATVRKIGDCLKSADLLNCIHSGYDAGCVIGV